MFVVSVNNGQTGPAGGGGGTGDHVIPNDSHVTDVKAPRNDSKNRSTRPPPARRNDAKPKEALVNGTTA